jgi:hypothetical protein
VRRIVAATWRLERAERLEGEIFAQNSRGTTSFGLAMIRDCNGARAFDTLLRYRGGTLAELWRALRTLKALQAEQAARPDEPPIEPERRTIAGESELKRASDEPAQQQAPPHAPEFTRPPVATVLPRALVGQPERDRGHAGEGRNRDAEAVSGRSVLGPKTCPGSQEPGRHLRR